ETKKKAHAKLAKFATKIGYPEKWRDWSALEVERDDIVGNDMRAAAVTFDRNIKKLGGPIDQTEWLMTPQTVNAYYYPPANEIVFPAAILQPPFFNVEADDAVNYGAIGGVIGHEISHGFDDQGRRYDGDGNLNDWWAPEDNEEFARRAKQLGAQYSALSPMPGLNVNGDLTMGENIADLAGLSMAYRAYKLSLKGKEAPVIDGFTGDQRFFIGWAQGWARKYRDDELRKRLLTDPHSPSEYRTNAVVMNVAEFHEAFNTKPGDKMYRPPEERGGSWGGVGSGRLKQPVAGWRLTAREEAEVYASHTRMAFGFLARQLSTVNSHPSPSNRQLSTLRVGGTLTPSGRFQCRKPHSAVFRDTNESHRRDLPCTFCVLLRSSPAASSSAAAATTRCNSRTNRCGRHGRRC